VGCVRIQRICANSSSRCAGINLQILASMSSIANGLAKKPSAPLSMQDFCTSAVLFELMILQQVHAGGYVSFRRHLQIENGDVWFVKRGAPNRGGQVVGGNDVVLFTERPVQLLGDCRVIVDDQYSALHRQSPTFTWSRGAKPVPKVGRTREANGYSSLEICKGCCVSTGGNTLKWGCLREKTVVIGHWSFAIGHLPFKD
jgi:hypothetical protein